MKVVKKSTKYKYYVTEDLPNNINRLMLSFDVEVQPNKAPKITIWNNEKAQNLEFTFNGSSPDTVSRVALALELVARTTLKISEVGGI